MTRLRLSLLLLLVFGACLVASEQEEESEESEESLDESEEDIDTNVTVSLTREICLDATVLKKRSLLRKLCCGQHYDADEATMICLDQPTPEVQSDEEDFIFISKVAECTYKKKKFMKGEHDLNFKRIWAAASKLRDRRERIFMMDMYEACSYAAKDMLEDPENNTAGIRRPFYTYVYLCVATYSMTMSCPYFRWQNLKDQERSDLCEEWENKCQKLLHHGL